MELPIPDALGGWATNNQDKIVTTEHVRESDSTRSPEEETLARAQKVAELKRKVDSGTYLIKQYEIIEGLLNSMTKTLD